MPIPKAAMPVLAVMMQQLEAFEENDLELNTILIGNLLDLEAEAASVIEKVFAAERLDEFMVGSWAGVQVALGLKQESDFTPAKLKPKVPEYLADIRKMLDIYETNLTEPQGFGKASPAPKGGQKKGGKKKKKK